MVKNETTYGFTLIEVMIAMLLLTIALTGLAGMQATMLKSSNGSRATTAATTLAQSAIEQFRSANFLSITAGTEEDCFLYDMTAVDCSAVHFYERTRVTTVSTVGFQNGFQQTATVTWGDEAGEQSLSLVSERIP